MQGVTFDPSLAASAAQASTTQGIFNNYEYQTLTNQDSLINLSNISTIAPYDFNDGFVPLTNDDLMNMSLSSLLSYSNVVSTSAGLQYSTILANQQLKNEYIILSQLSQSTIDGLSHELQVNRAAQFANQQREIYLYGQSTMYVSTIAQYELDIAAQSNIILTSDSSIIGLTTESSTIDIIVNYQDQIFISSAIGYSTLYYTFLGWDSALQGQICTINAISTVLSNDIIAEQAAYQNLLNSTFTWQQKSNQLSSLYQTSNALQSTLTEQRINEAYAIAYHQSTIYSVSTLEKRYSAALTNRDYAVSLSTQTSLADKYISALTIFTQADIAYNNSIPQQGGKQIGGATVPGNQILWSARNMANQALSTAKINKESAEQITSTLQTLAGIANTDLYDTTIMNLENTVIAKMYLINTLNGYKTSSLQSVAKFSSIYDSAITEMNGYNTQVKMYSSFYESSIIGASTLLGLSDEDDRTIASEQAAADAISWGISSLNVTYDNYMSSYYGYILLSSMYNEQNRMALNNLSTVSSFYDSTNNAMITMSNTVDNLNRSIAQSTIAMFAQSSILNSQLINLAVFDTQIKNNVNVQERASYEYRETFCRLKRIDLQNSYESQVLSVIQAASTTSGQLQAANPMVAITPTTANLNTPAITSAYNSLTSINSFLSNFNTIYNVYDSQTSNIQSLSTSIGAQNNAWSTLSVYDSANFYSVTPVPDIQAKVVTANVDFSQKQGIVATALQTYIMGQNTLASAKQTFSTGYTTFFNGSEMLAQESTISSFMISGYRQAIANLAAQGVIFSL
jgi:hypothetical protein